MASSTLLADLAASPNTNGNGDDGRRLSLAGCFAMLDTDSDGRISKQEFLASGSLIFRNVTTDQMSKMFETIDEDKSGDISMEEFIKLYQQQHSHSDVQIGLQCLSNLQFVFAAMDKDNNGTLDFQEFTNALRMYGCKETDEQLLTLFKSADKDDSNCIDYREFSTIVRSSSVCKRVCHRVISGHIELDLVHETISLSEAAIDPQALKILRYWFPETLSACMDLWFGKDDKTDVYIDATFGNMVLGARGGEYNHWINSPMETLALVILLDQVPRNIVRHSPDMFSCDPLALSVVTRSMYYGYHTSVCKLQSIFFCLVLTHSESIHHQELCVEIWESITVSLPSDDPLRKFNSIFLKHLQVVERFGRFPHRNEVLGRTSTDTELDFLEDTSFRFDLPMKSDCTGFANSLKFQSNMVTKAMVAPNLLPNNDIEL